MMNVPYKGYLTPIILWVYWGDKLHDLRLQDLPPVFESLNERNENLSRYDSKAVYTEAAASRQLQNEAEQEKNTVGKYVQH